MEAVNLGWKGYFFLMVENFILSDLMNKLLKAKLYMNLKLKDLIGVLTNI